MPRIAYELRVCVAADPNAIVPPNELHDVANRLRGIALSTALDAGHARNQVTIRYGEIRAAGTVLLEGTSPAGVGLDRVIRSLSDRDPSLLPPDARHSLALLWSKVRSRGWMVQIRKKDGVEAMVVGSQELPSLETITQEATLAGTLRRANYSQSSILFKLPSGVIRTFGTESPAIAQELSGLIHQEVVLTGRASWFVGTQQLADFIVTGFQRRSP